VIQTKLILVQLGTLQVTLHPLSWRFS